MSLSNNFPAVRPSLLLDFARAKALDPRITFTRASTATFYDEDGILQTAQNNVPRFEHNPATEESLGLLIEEQRTNLILRSEEFDNAYWTKNNSSITANIIVAPSGELTGDALIENTATSTHTVSRVITYTASAHTLSVYAKPAGRNFVRLVIGDGTNSFAVYFDIATGVVGTILGAATASIASVGNGWYRCAITATTLAAAGSVSIRTASSNGVDTYTGDGTSGAFLWGAQLEAGAFPTSYIPTVASQVTRSADNASMTGTNFSSWFNNAEGTIYCEAAYTSLEQNFPMTASINNGATANSISLFKNTTGSNQIVYNGFVDAVSQFSLFSNTTTPSLFYKVAASYRFNDIAASGNAGAVVTDTTSNIPVVNQLNIGSRVGSFFLNGTIKKLAYYPFRLPNNQLQALTGS